MDNRIKELIAVGASITANCMPCLEFHAAKAKENGADDRDIMTAIAMGKAVRKGAASKMDQFTAQFSSEESETGSACGCGSAKQNSMNEGD